MDRITPTRMETQDNRVTFFHFKRTNPQKTRKGETLDEEMDLVFRMYHGVEFGVRGEQI